MRSPWFRRPASSRPQPARRPRLVGAVERLDCRDLPAVGYTFVDTSFAPVLVGSTGPGNDTVAITTSATNTVVVNGVDSLVPAPSILSIVLTGDAAGDRFDLSGVAAGEFTGLVDVSVDGGLGANRLLLNDDPHAIALLGPDGGAGSSVTGSAYTVFFDRIGSLTGGAGDDLVTLADGAGWSGALAGHGGTDTLDYSAYSQAVTVDLGSGSATNIAGGAAGFRNVTGGLGNDVLTGTADNNLLVGGIGDDTLATGPGGIDTLDGGSGRDLFAVVPRPGSDTTLSGGADGDTVSFAAAAVGVRIDMDGAGVQTIAAGSTLRFDPATDVESFLGSAFDDTITIAPVFGLSRTVDGGAPARPALPGDTLNLNLLLTPAPTNGTLTLTGPEAAIYTSDEYNSVAYAGIETFAANAPIPNLVVNATPTVRDFRVVRNGAFEEIRDITGGATPGALYFSVDYALIDTLTVSGTTARPNRVVLDFGGGGTPIPAGGFGFDGRALNNGLAVAGDQLDVAGGGPVPVAFGTVQIDTAGANAGAVRFTSSAMLPLGTARFTGLDGLDLSGGTLPYFQHSTAIASLTLNLFAGATDTSLADAGPAADGVSQAASTGAAQIVAVRFPNPAALIQIDATAAGAQTIRLGGMDAGFAPTQANLLGTAADLFWLTSVNFLQTPAPGVSLTAAKFDLNGISDTAAWVQGTGELALSAGAVLTTGDASDRTFAGRVSGTGGFVKRGAGTWTLAGAASNTATGPATVIAGTLELNKAPGSLAIAGDLVIGDGVGGNDADIVRLRGAGDQIAATTNVTVRSSGLLDLNGFNQTVGPLTLESGPDGATVTGHGGTLTLAGAVTTNSVGGGTVGANLDDGTLNLGSLNLVTGQRSFAIADGAATSDLAIGMVVVGTAGVRLAGAGRTELAASGNSYRGGTAIAGGVLRVSGSLVGAGAGDIQLTGPGVVLEGGPSGLRSITGRGAIVNASNAVIQNLQALTKSASEAGVAIAANASATLLNNTITGNRYGIDINGPGGPTATRAWVQGNDLRGNFGSPGSPGAGLRIQGGAWVDAGQRLGGYDFTGLQGGGVGTGSLGQNIFGTNSTDSYPNATGTGVPAVSQAILNLKNGSPDSLAGPQGPPSDVYAQFNDFGFGMGSTNYLGIEARVYHDADSAARGFVNYVSTSAAQPTLLAAPQLYARDVTESPAQRSMIRRVRFRFDDFVFIGAGSSPGNNGGVQVEKVASAADLPGQTGSAYLGAVTTSKIAITFDVPTGEFRYDFGFTGLNGVEPSGSLVDGRYLLRLDGLQIRAGHPTLGQPLTMPLPGPAITSGSTGEYRFFRLFGDVDGSGTVTSVDQTAFLAAYNSRLGSANYRAYLDSDFDLDVDSADSTQFQRRLNRYVTPLRMVGDL